jgi:ribonuclease G
MSERIFLALSPERSEFYRWSGERLIQALIERAGEGSRLGGVYLGRVVTLEKSLNAAFVDIGSEKPALLHLKKHGTGISEGDVVTVQVKRDAREDKGAKVSLSISTTENVEAAKAGKTPPANLVPPPALWQTALAALEPGSIDSVCCGRRVDVERVANWCRRIDPKLAGRVEFQARRDWEPSDDAIAEEVAAALETEVPLPGGGQLLVEPVRTLTAIDVNSAAATGQQGIEQTALGVNIEAAREIPRQLALRNLGGIVVIDFIDMENRNRRDQVVEALRQAVALDPAIDWVGNMSRLGLVELLRKRTGPSLAEMWAKRAVQA